MQQKSQQGGAANITVETRTDGTTVASELFATYPLRLHLTKRPDHKDENASSSAKALNCYVLGYGGGMISGDVNDLSIKVKPHSKLVVTSQSTSKAFKAVEGRESTCVRTRAKVARGGFLFLVPQPMQCFGGSILTLNTEVTLEGIGSESFSENDDPSLLLVDWYTGGRENLDGGRWQLSSFQSRTTVSICASEYFSKDDEDSTDTGRSKLVFRDATRLSGGMELQNHMRNYNVICMVILMGPKVKQVASKFLENYSSRRTYDDREDGGEEEDYKIPKPSKTMDYNRGEGLNRQDEGLLVSCGTFQTCQEGRFETGVIVRLAATTLEIAAKFLSKHIGTLEGQLEDDPFLEILVSKQGLGGTGINMAGTSQAGRSKERFSFGLMAKSYEMSSMSSNSTKNDLPMCMSSIFSNDLMTKGMNPLTLFQLVDSCVPSGGFAHSNTLEAAHQLHLLDNSKSSWTGALSNHIWEVLLNTVTSVIPFLIASCQLFRDNCHNETKRGQEGNHPPSQTTSVFLTKEWEKLDALLRASTTSHVASRASTTQGSGMLRAFSSSFHEIAPMLKALKRSTLKVHNSLADCTGHGATSFGAVCGLLKIDDWTCCSMYLYTVLRDMVNAAVRMNLVGPLEGGRLIHDLSLAVETLLESELPRLLGQVRTNVLDVECAHQVCPMIEILSNAHDRLYTRLFNS